jgi:short-subunit dehydrogenase
LAEIDPQRVKAVYETNVFSTLRLTQKVVLKLIENGEGRIIFMGSMAGVIPTPFYAPYAMTKFALESVAFSLRTELKPFGIKVIIINPRGYNTGFNERFMSQKYGWMNAHSLYKDHMAYVRQEEERVIKRELQSKHCKTSRKSGRSPAAFAQVCRSKMGMGCSPLFRRFG